MKNILILAAVLFSTSAYSTDPREVERLTTKCEGEKSSHFRNPRTPTCDRLEVILQEEERLKDIPEDQPVSFQPRGNQFCAINKRNVPLYCH